MVKFDLLSPNLLIILNKILENENIKKTLYYNVKNPLLQPTVTEDLFLVKVFPYPFNPNAVTDSCSQIRVYYPTGKIKEKVVEDTVIYFDIIVAKDLWLVNNGNPTIRPYDLMKEVVNIFYDNPIQTVGILKFNNFNHISVNDKFDCIRIIASMITL